MIGTLDRLSLEQATLVYHDIPAIGAELVLCGTVVVLLLARMFFPQWNWVGHLVAGIGAVVAFALLVAHPPAESMELFGGLLVHDLFGYFFRVLLVGFLVLFVLFTVLTGLPSPAIATEFYLLTFGSMAGMCLMVGANHMVSVMVALEMAGLPGYALAGIRKQTRPGTEAALKFAIFGAASSGILFFGLSILAALLGTVHLPSMATRLAERLPELAARPAELSLVGAGLVFVAAGLAFKLSLVPFHFWTPDVFQGATAEVACYLSVASKVAALALFIRLLIVWVYPLSSLSEITAGSFTSGKIPLTLGQIAALVLALIAAISCTLGNLAAFGQRNIKRLLAYSTIAHAGYLAMGLAAVATTLDKQPELCRQAIAAVLFYAGVYMFMNFGIFAVAAFLRNQLGTEEIAGYAGWGRHNTPVLVAATVCLFSLVGLPPLAGFMAKFALLAAVASAGLWWLVVIAVVNTVFSLFYYLRIVKALALEEGTAPAELQETFPNPLANIFVLTLAGALIFLGIWWELPFRLCLQAAAAVLPP